MERIKSHVVKSHTYICHCLLDERDKERKKKDKRNYNQCENKMSQVMELKEMTGMYI